MRCPSDRPLRWLGLWLLVGLLGLTACHDSPRRNPLDPELTPPVTLAVVADDTLGTATLTWSAYRGPMAFRVYRVLRNATHSTEVETLATVASQADTVFVDRNRQPEVAYEYRVAVVSQAGLSAESEIRVVSEYTLAEVRLLPAGNDSLAGVVRLRWSRYRGARFGEYRVQRKVVGRDEVETLTRITTPDDTVYADGQALNGIDYLYWVVTLAAGKELASNSQEGQLRLPAVVITRADLVSLTARASLAWTRYRGPRFAGYRVERTGGEEPRTVFTSQSLADTACVDRGLAGDIPYAYRVVVVTTRDEEVTSEPRGGAIHAFERAWSLPLADPADRVRLYWVNGELVALVTAGGGMGTAGGVSLLHFDREGSLRQRQLLLDWSFAAYLWSPERSSFWFVEPRTVSAARAADGDWLVACVDPVSTGDLLILAYSPDGEPRWQGQPLGAWRVPWTAADSVRAGGWSVHSASQRSLDILRRREGTCVDALSVDLDGAPVLAGSDFLLRGSWDQVVDVPSIPTVFDPAGFLLLSQDETVTGERQGIWARASLAVGFTLAATDLSLFSGPRSGDRWLWQLRLPAGSDRVYLVLTVDGEGGKATTQAIDLPRPLASWAPYRVRMEISDTTASAILEHNIRWQGHVGPATQAVSLVPHGAELYAVVDSLPLVIDPQGAAVPAKALAGTPGEARAWPQGSLPEAYPGMGVCLPEQHQVIYAQGASRSWPLASPARVILGRDLSSGQGNFILPISFDVGPDGRVFVLDAGGATVQSFRATGQPITGWGRRGAGPGEFDLGQGLTATEHAGSLAVDDQGAIYVWDSGNQRIVKFAP